MASMLRTTSPGSSTRQLNVPQAIIQGFAFRIINLTVLRWRDLKDSTVGLKLKRCEPY
jgi:hypothetical protein